jgi:hypothetical protein
MKSRDDYIREKETYKKNKKVLYIIDAILFTVALTTIILRLPITGTISLVLFLCTFIFGDRIIKQKLEEKETIYKKIFFKEVIGDIDIQLRDHYVQQITAHDLTKLITNDKHVQIIEIKSLEGLLNKQAFHLTDVLINDHKMPEVNHLYSGNCLVFYNEKCCQDEAIITSPKFMFRNKGYIQTKLIDEDQDIHIYSKEDQKISPEVIHYIESIYHASKSIDFIKITNQTIIVLCQVELDFPNYDDINENSKVEDYRYFYQKIFEILTIKY